MINIFKKISKKEREMQKNRKKLFESIERAKKELLFEDAFSEKYNQFSKEITYLKQIKEIIPFPYEYIENYQKTSIEVTFDNECCLNYVIHNEKRLYFPKKFDKAFIQIVYAQLTCEQDKESPHRYFTDDFFVEQGDVFFDVGCADAMMALENVEKISQLFLLECDKEWKLPLEMTFKPWREKVEIITKIAGNKTTRNMIQLDDLIEKADSRNITIKMDVEGYEKEVLEGATRLLLETNVKCACCTYHRQEDAKELEEFWKEKQYKTEFSKGYMLFIYGAPYGNVLTTPYFRKGVLRARK